MATLKNRVEQLHKEVQFRQWLSFERFLESWTEQQLEEYACLGRLPEPLPEPLPRGASKLDGLDRKSLIKLWLEDERTFEGRSKEELEVYNTHRHWPEQACDEKNCKKAEFDERVRRLEAKAQGGNV